MKETGDMLRKHCRVFYGVDSSNQLTREQESENKDRPNLHLRECWMLD